MIRNIFNTFFTRTGIALIGLLVVVITARYLGAEVRGEISLFVLNVTLIFQVVSVAGGGLIYYTPRRPVYSLIFSTLIWSVIVIPIMVLVLFLAGFVESEQLKALALASLLVSWFLSGLTVLIGFEKIRTYNFLSLFQMVFLIGLLVGFLFKSRLKGFEMWLWAYLISYGMALLGMIILLFRRIKNNVLVFRWSDFSALINYGKWTQLANITQLLNYRLGYYLIEYFEGKTALGIYSSAVIIAEGTWLISKSFATVVLARIVNLESKAEALKLTLVYARISLYFSLVVILVLLILPSVFYTWLLGEDFSEVKLLVVYLSPGIASFALTTIYAHYFSGTGRPSVSSISSILGLIVTLGLGIWLIPLYGKMGAAITASLSFIVSGIYLTHKIRLEEGIKFKDLLPHSSDIEKAKQFLFTFFYKSR